MWTLNQILFPTDLSDFSRTALPFACTLARQFKAKLNVLHVMPPLLYEEELQERNHPDQFYAGAIDALERFVTPEPGIEIERTVTTGKAAKAIVEAAADSHTSLIVMATHGKTGLARLFLGSVTEQVLRDAACPVLCVKVPELAQARMHQQGLMFRTILCPVDFSDTCKAALDLAFTLASEQKARVVLLHVASLPDVAYMGYGAPGAPLEMNEYLEDMREALQKTDSPNPQVPVERRLEDGNPPDVIVQVAREINADLILLGTHGYKGLTHAVMGSVAEHVVRKAPCPVLTLRAAKN